jgi:hypothetical protein
MRAALRAKSKQKLVEFVRSQTQVQMNGDCFWLVLPGQFVGFFD